MGNDTKVWLLAAELVRKGWMQGDYAKFGKKVVQCKDDLPSLVRRGNTPDCVCAIGALVVADTLAGNDLSHTHSMMNTASERLTVDRGQHTSLWLWNDTPGRQAEEVAHLFERLAGKET